MIVHKIFKQFVYVKRGVMNFEKLYIKKDDYFFILIKASLN